MAALLSSHERWALVENWQLCTSEDQVGRALSENRRPGRGPSAVTLNSLENAESYG